MFVSFSLGNKVSLLLASQIAVLVSGSDEGVGTVIRQAMRTNDYNNIALYVGVMLLVTGIFLAIFTIIAAYTAWVTILPVSDANMEAIFRSKFGMHVMSIPNKLATATVYVYLSWMTMLLWQMLPMTWGIIYTVLALLLFFYLHFVFSGLSRIIMHSKAMQTDAIFSNGELWNMRQEDYDKALLEMVQSNQQQPTTISSLFSTSRVSADDVRLQYHHHPPRDDSPPCGDDDDDNDEDVTTTHEEQDSSQRSGTPDV
jgi:hypothetical protein